MSNQETDPGKGEASERREIVIIPQDEPGEVAVPRGIKVIRINGQEEDDQEQGREREGGSQQEPDDIIMSKKMPFGKIS